MPAISSSISIIHYWLTLCLEFLFEKENDKSLAAEYSDLIGDLNIFVILNIMVVIWRFIKKKKDNSNYRQLRINFKVKSTNFGAKNSNKILFDH